MNIERLLKRVRLQIPPLVKKKRNLKESYLRTLIESELWRTNPSIQKRKEPLFLHVGCGNNVLSGFANIDFLPEDERVVCWNLLYPWPSEIHGTVDGVYSEEVLEHFFYLEQMYILCESNLALKDGKIKRVLMPSIERGFEYLDGRKRDPTPLEIDNSTVAFSDFFNLAMRHSGHRWLHSTQSFCLLAGKCGFEPNLTSCSESNELQFSGINLRNEKNSWTFAHDLKLKRKLSVLRIDAKQVFNAEFVCMLAPRQPLYRSTSSDPIIIYSLERPVRCGSIALANVRSSNFSERSEHNSLQYYFTLSEEGSKFVDRSMSSTPFNNFMEGGFFSRTLGEDHMLMTLRIDPTDKPNHFFTVGPLEIFYFI